MEIDVAPEVVAFVRRLREEALTLDLTLRFAGDLAVKDAIAYAGTGEEAAGFRRVPVGGLDVYWRQRLLVEGSGGATVTDRVVPRRVAVRVDGDVLAADVTYA